MGQDFINGCTHGVTSYIVIRPLTTIIAFACELTGTYGEGQFSPKHAYLYLAVINSCSQMWAMYCLILFYYAFKEDLAGIKPLAKFICIKAVVFFSFWQAVLVSFLFSVGIIKDDPRWTTYNKESVAAGIQDFLICIEMFLAALAHHFCTWVLTERKEESRQRVERERGGRRIDRWILNRESPHC